MKATAHLDAPKSRLLVGTALGAVIGLVACAPGLIGSGFSGPMIGLSFGVIGCLAAAGTWFWLAFNMTEVDTDASTRLSIEPTSKVVDDSETHSIAA